jgi:flagellar hook-basal body complex protein FliE
MTIEGISAAHALGGTTQGIRAPLGEESLTATSPGGFDNVLGRILTEANQDQFTAEKAVDDLIAGRTNSLHEAVLATAKADLSMQLVIELRNKLVESYQEIMRMQV